MENQSLQSTKDSIQKYSNIKETDRFIFKCGYNEVELTAKEYKFVDTLLFKIKNGEINPSSIYKCKRTGESFNLAHFMYLIRKKDSSPKIFGEDLIL